jgi:hypothetical protein
METVFNSFSLATGEAYTQDGILVTSSASATASSNVSQEDADTISKNLANNIAKQSAKNDANIIDQSTELALQQGYFLPKVNNLPNEIINTSLNLSFRDIGYKLDELLNYLITTLLPTPLYQEIINNTTQDPVVLNETVSVLRRLFSNYVNNPNNITDKNGKYIGDKYGLRILYCSNDGFVNADVQTFCKNVAVQPYVGANNNYLVNYINPVPVLGTTLSNTVIFNASNIDLSKTEKIPNQLNVLKCRSPELPKSPDQTKLIYNVIGPAPEYKIIPETPPQTSIFNALQIIDNHGTRLEIQGSRGSNYGYAARRSDTTFLFNWYVAKNLDNIFFSNPGTSFTLRLSYFEF